MGSSGAAGEPQMTQMGADEKKLREYPVGESKFYSAQRKNHLRSSASSAVKP
jgi:hypothetical protein